MKKTLQMEKKSQGKSIWCLLDFASRHVLLMGNTVTLTGSAAYLTLSFNIISASTGIAKMLISRSTGLFEA